MDPVRNPFAPGAGSQPPELAGRDEIIENSDTAIGRSLLGKPSRSQILLGLRGTGKTVLLNRIERLAVERGMHTSFIEAPEGKALVNLLYPKLSQTLRRVSLSDRAKQHAHAAMRALRGFASVFKIDVGDVSLSVDPEPGVADSGNLEYDLIDLFTKIGEAAKAADSGWTLLIDELQYVDESDLASLIVALHRCAQLGLPILFFGAGLPQIAALSGNAKSYAERLFEFPSVGPLPKEAARAAIREPIEAEQERIDDDALEALIEQTGCYPYFLQEWGYQAWNTADASPIDRNDVENATRGAIGRLDQSFFRVRFDRLTPKEREYVFAMARLGGGPYRSADVATELGEDMRTLGPRRASIIAKGMIYSPAHGDIAFTVPMFDDFLQRIRAA